MFNNLKSTNWIYGVVEEGIEEINNLVINNEDIKYSRIATIVYLKQLKK